MIYYFVSAIHYIHSMHICVSVFLCIIGVYWSVWKSMWLDRESLSRFTFSEPHVLRYSVGYFVRNFSVDMLSNSGNNVI